MTLANVVELTLQQDGDLSELQQKSAAVAAALNGQPFGKRDELIQSARDLADASLKWTDKLNATKIDEGTARRFLTHLATVGSSVDVDYDSARQLAWAYERTLAQLHERKSREGDLAPPLRSMGEEERFGEDPLLQHFEQPLLVWLRKNRQTATSVSLSAQGESFSHPQNDININQALLKIAKYDPRPIQEIFEQLLKQLDGDARH